MKNNLVKITTLVLTMTTAIVANAHIIDDEDIGEDGPNWIYSCHYEGGSYHGYAQTEIDIEIYQENCIREPQGQFTYSYIGVI